MTKSKGNKGIAARVRRYLRSTRAVSALEYAILVGVIAVGITAALGTFKESLEDALDTIGDTIDDTVSDIGETEEDG